jgi:hypothetical protein
MMLWESAVMKKKMKQVPGSSRESVDGSDKLR